MSISPKKFKTILIAGPTASGKSAFALEIAQKKGGVIINADSMQVYRELRLLTARPSEEDEAFVPHKLYGVISAREAYSVGKWLNQVQAELEAAHKAAQMPIIVGGTGLYFSALLNGLSPIPEIPDDIREYWRAKAKELGGPALHALLAQKDPEMALRLRPSDPQRLVRALEVMEATGRSLAYWQEKPGEPLLTPQNVRRGILLPERETLYARCNTRFDLMIDQGVLKEVQAFTQLDLDPNLPASRALGLKPLSEHLAGKLSLQDAVDQAKSETRRYAKRQMTWFRTQMPDWQVTTGKMCQFLS